MSRLEKAKPKGGNPWASDSTTAWESDSGAKHSPQEAQALFLALSAINTAREHLDRYAVDTDTPAQGVVEAADLLEAAADSLALVALSDAPQCAPAGDP